MEVLAQTDPSGFAKVVHEEMMACRGQLVAYAAFLTSSQLQSEYDRRQVRGEWLPSDAFRASAANVMAIHLQVAKLQQIDANTQRLVEQARMERLANDKTEAKSKRSRPPTRRQRRTTSRPQPTPSASRISGDLL
jgi:hypothetical protein